MKKSKKLIFTGLMILIVLICVEGMARLTYFVMYRRAYDVSNLYNFVKYSNYKLSDEFALWWDQEIIHPYLGFLIDFKDEKKNKETYGFTTSVNPVIKREPGKLNVLVLGGSVAQSMGEILRVAFHRVCRVAPNVVTLGEAGYKQPQQLLALTYFLSLGAEYDLIINLDGYNEIVLPVADNYSVGVNPFFPRNWNLRISRQPSKKILAEIGKVRYMRDLKEENLEALTSSFFRGSAVFGLLKVQQFKRINWDIDGATHKLISLQQKEVKRFEETGPFFAYKDIQELYDDAAAVWLRSSVLLDQLARENSMEYYHFLQPNQYVKGSKVLTAEEKRTAYLERPNFSQSALIGYPILIKQGRKLLERNIKFFDTTMVYAKEKETVYIDICCHFNERGKEVLAAYMMDKILQNPRIKPFLKEPLPSSGPAKN
ncbi:MAG: hypothetical protein Q8L00_04010 [Deltaproteobacteria bacterium]|nr:hypothetical protein [Deltaproteobacteria bacterium]